MPETAAERAQAAMDQIEKEKKMAGNDGENEEEKGSSGEKEAVNSSEDDIELTQDDIKKIQALIKEQDETIEGHEKKFKE